MIGVQWALLRREFWEHRSFFVTPVVIAIIVILMAITGQLSIMRSIWQFSVPATSVTVNEPRPSLPLPWP